MGFLTVAVLVCTMTQHGNKQVLSCTDHGTSNLRTEQIVSKKDIKYTKCSNVTCDLTEWDGCKYTLNDKTVVYSSETCE
jgi:hypothetical protein